MKRRLWNPLQLYTLALFILVSDQCSKLWIARTYAPGESRDVIPGFFALTYEQNSGGAFSILQHSALGLAVASVVVATAIILFTTRSRPGLPSALAIALALALGGALGNLFDRVRLRYVVDFLDVHVGLHQWPVFNVADSAICTGVILLAIWFWLTPTPTSSNERTPAN